MRRSSVEHKAGGSATGHGVFGRRNEREEEKKRQIACRQINNDIFRGEQK